ncbi:PAS domain S-box protein [Tolypothrix bouteillei VB521301]|uniref:PAS domain S-box protein n=1 Tax=Tolypothrix bouteillei VB521301 TaxID=1479485 RepID=A0A0C1RDN6_9CYAN|nr:PAS domain S-box protein [Tolypothrix bouteillei VB521301]
MEIETFAQRAEGMYRRLETLYSDSSGTVNLSPDRLPQTFMELGHASEIVKLATEELYQQNEEIAQLRNLAEIERQRYRELFELAPDAYLVTDNFGIIQEANRLAAHMFNLSQHYLVGKPIANYVPLDERHRFRSFLKQLEECGDKAMELVLCFLKRNGDLFDAAITVAVTRNKQGQLIEARWLIRDISEQQAVLRDRHPKLAELASINHDSNLEENRLLHKYCKGETIPLNPSAIWYVSQGVVKLSTLCETGEEVLIGLAGEGMVFGSSLTSLHIYQATALSDTELSPISLAEISTSETLSQTLLPKINRRLRQTEAFLAVVGRRRVEDRLDSLLQLLKQEIGQKVPQGICFSVRLTHEDLASACCTTRVTITRLMGKLQKQGKIGFDSKNHIILKHL